jgi:signal transduction histidine kinase
VPAWWVRECCSRNPLTAHAAAQAQRQENPTPDTAANGRDELDEIGRVHRLYAVLSRVNEAIIRVRSQQELLEEACRIAVEEGGFALAWIGFVVPETQRIQVHAKHGRDDGYLDNIEISFRDDVPEGGGPTGVAMREGRPSVNNDTANDPTVAPWREEQLKRGYRSSASFPLKVAGATIGVITLYSGSAHYFDEEEVRLLSVLADDFSFALEAAEMARARAAAEEELTRERAHLARDLHDSVTQALFAVSLKAESLTESREVELSPAVAKVAHEVQRLSRGALAQMRSLLLELRGVALEEVPIDQLLRNAIEAAEARTATALRMTIAGEAPLPVELHVAVYRITQEALNNVARHARASSASVELVLSPASMRLSIKDDGCGFEPGAVGPTHLGLSSMRERAAEAGAELRVDSTPGAGTEIVLEWQARPAPYSRSSSPPSSISSAQAATASAP